MLSKEMTKNGIAVVAGKFVSEPQKSHIVKHVMYYSVLFEVQRLSGDVDTLPILINEDMLEYVSDEGLHQITGYVHTHNYTSNGKRCMQLNICAQKIEEIDTLPHDNNTICLTGFVVREPILRVTPLSKTICETVIAVNYTNGESAYIPVIAFAPTAAKLKKRPYRTSIAAIGRLQSRVYTKEVDSTIVQKITYECAIHTIT